MSAWEGPNIDTHPYLGATRFVDLNVVESYTALRVGHSPVTEVGSRRLPGYFAIDSVCSAREVDSESDSCKDYGEQSRQWIIFSLVNRPKLSL